MVFDRSTRPAVPQLAITLVTCGMVAAGVALAANRPAQASSPSDEPPVVLVQSTQRLGPLSPFLAPTTTSGSVTRMACGIR